VVNNLVFLNIPEGLCQSYLKDVRNFPVGRNLVTLGYQTHRNIGVGVDQGNLVINRDTGLSKNELFANIKKRILWSHIFISFSLRFWFIVSSKSDFVKNYFGLFSLMITGAYTYLLQGTV